MNNLDDITVILKNMSINKNTKSGIKKKSPSKIQKRTKRRSVSDLVRMLKSTNINKNISSDFKKVIQSQKKLEQTIQKEVKKQEKLKKELENEEEEAEEYIRFLKSIK
jgi:hypothetical protein